MRHLQKNNFLTLVLILSGCITQPTFKITSHKFEPKKVDPMHTIIVNSNRVIQECYYMNAETPENWRHHYFIYILKNDNTVLTLTQGSDIDAESCNIQLKKINKILEKENFVRICARGNYEKDPNITDSKFYDFKSLGQHKTSTEQMDLDIICNSKNCFSNNGVYTNTCPGFPKYKLNDEN